MDSLAEMEPPVRIELTTFRLQGGCSTTELGRQFQRLSMAVEWKREKRESVMKECAPYADAYLDEPRDHFGQSLADAQYRALRANLFGWRLAIPVVALSN